MGRWFAFADRMELIEGSGIGRRQRLHGHWGRKRSEIDQEIDRLRASLTGLAAALDGAGDEEPSDERGSTGGSP
jgi:hypothetical protein